jgi:hypothetical protein
VAKKACHAFASTAQVGLIQALGPTRKIMVALFSVLMALAILLILPGWLWFRRKRPQSAWLLALPVFGVGLWLALTLAGVGAQSLSNIVESLAIAATAVVVAYIKLLAFDPSSALRSRGA